MLITKTRKWGNSLGLRIPKDEVKKLKLRENQDVILDIRPKENVLKELYGIGKGKISQSTEEILNEIRKDMSKYF